MTISPMHTILSLLMLLSIGCQHHAMHEPQFLYHDDGKAKPRVSIVSVFDNSGSQLTLNLADDFTSSITSRVIQSGKFYLTQDFTGLTKLRVSAVGVNPFLEDISWIREMDSTTEFVVFTEIIQYILTPPVSSGFFSPQTLDIALRIKILDIRGDKPRIILQEILQESFNIPWRLGNAKALAISPLGMAHTHMAKKATEQIQDYILLAQIR